MSCQKVATYMHIFIERCKVAHSHSLPISFLVLLIWGFPPSCPPRVQHKLLVVCDSINHLSLHCSFFFFRLSYHSTHSFTHSFIGLVVCLACLAHFLVHSFIDRCLTSITLWLTKVIMPYIRDTTMLLLSIS